MAARPRAETYADGGIERRAGKGWQQLETERLQREGATVEAQVRNVVLPWAARRLASQVGSVGNDVLRCLLRQFLRSRFDTPHACVQSDVAVHVLLPLPALMHERAICCRTYRWPSWCSGDRQPWSVSPCRRARPRRPCPPAHCAQVSLNLKHTRLFRLHQMHHASYRRDVISSL